MPFYMVIVTCCAIRDGLQSRHRFHSQCILPHDQSQRFAAGSYVGRTMVQILLGQTQNLKNWSANWIKVK